MSRDISLSSASGSISHFRQTDRHLALLALCLAMLVAQIDTAVANLATHAIGESFDAGVNTLQWVIDGYNLVYAALLLTGGVLADMKGRRLIFLIGLGLFSAASVLCALAPNIWTLILGRCLAGLGAAFIIPASLAIIRVVWTDPNERSHVLGLWTAASGLAMTLGPTLGGLLVDSFGWRSIFFVVVPFSLVALVLARVAIPESSDPKDRHFDLGAQVLGMLALGGLCFAAIEVGAVPYLAIAALVITLLAGMGFLRVERQHGPAALVPLDLFSSRAFRGAIGGAICMTFTMYGVLFLLPLVWQSAGRLSPLVSGLALLPMGLAFMLASPLSGKLTPRFGVNGVSASGLLVIAFGVAIIAMSSSQSTLIMTEIGLALTGVGMGLSMGPLIGAAVGAVDAARAGTASSVINVARIVGATIGVAILGTIYQLAGGGAQGLKIALLFGCALQLAGAVVAWRQTGS